tara:strand:- start:337 stop:591 length:255 start_codon:yes stop_codon:yes gene_type:complete
MPFLKTLAFIFIVYYFVKYTLRLLAPFILQLFAKKMQQKFKDQYNQHHENKQKEGEITIEGNKNNPKSKNHNVGDYVDFEEVDD